jgi:cytochrome b
MRRIDVWDVPTRVFHWALVVCVLGAYGTAEWGWLTLQWHFYFGYAVLVLCVFRLIWGVIGGEHARFINFLPTPKRLFNYLRGRGVDGQGTPSVGHNPMGALSVLALLALLLLQSISGLFNSDEIQWYGPLNERVSAKLAETMADLHERMPNLLLLLIGIHIIAILLYYLLKKINLLSPMLSGRKDLADDAPAHWRDAKSVPIAWALVALALSGGALWAVLRFWPQPELLY